MLEFYAAYLYMFHGSFQLQWKSCLGDKNQTEQESDIIKYINVDMWMMDSKVLRALDGHPAVFTQENQTWEWILLYGRNKD